jgi:hypothetical protein
MCVRVCVANSSLTQQPPLRATKGGIDAEEKHKFTCGLCRRFLLPTRVHPTSPCVRVCRPRAVGVRYVLNNFLGG